MQYEQELYRDIDTLSGEALTHYKDNLEVVGLCHLCHIVKTQKLCHIARVEAHIIIQYLLPPWLSSDPKTDDHFAHFVAKQHCFYSVLYLADYLRVNSVHLKLVLFCCQLFDFVVIVAVTRKTSILQVV